MKQNDIKALHDKTIVELMKQQADLEMELARTRFQKQAGKLENISLPKHLADDLARVKTVLKEKQLQAIVESKKEASANSKKKSAEGEEKK